MIAAKSPIVGVASTPLGTRQRKDHHQCGRVDAGDGQVDPDKLFPFHMHVHSLPAMPSDGPSLRA